MRRVSQVLSRLEVAFDDPKSVASAGLLLPMSLAQQLNVESRIDESLPSKGWGGRPNSGGKALTLVASLLAGGEFISDVAMLGSGATGRVIGHRLFSPSRCGEWLRSLTATDVAQMSDVNKDLVAAAWQAGLGPDTITNQGGPSATDPQQRLVFDIDSTVIETYGDDKQGTSKRNYQGIKGYHPLILAEASTGQVISGMLRDGNAAPGKHAASVIGDTLAKIRETVAVSQEIVLRADSGFYIKAVIQACRDNNVHYTVTIRQFPNIRELITGIAQDEYQPVTRTVNKRVDVAGIDYQIKGRPGTTPIDCRLIIRRTTTPKDTGDPQLRLFDIVEHWAFVTDLDGDPAELDHLHRQHAVIETVIRDLKYGMALNHMPSGDYNANAGWLQLNILAHNLARWTGRLISPTPVTAKTLRHRYLSCPGRITANSRKHVLHLPTNWPWKTQYLTALDRIHTLHLVD